METRLSQSAGIIYRDVKLENIPFFLLGMVKLGDFTMAIEANE